MEEGIPYPDIEEEDGSCMTACESVAAVRSTTSTNRHNIPLDDSYDPYKGYESVDFGFPRTLEELEAEIDYSEAH